MKRLKEIDILKGIGIFCVLIGHSIPDANTQISNYFWGGVFRWIYSFHMPLFIAISGFLYFDSICRCNVRSEAVLELKKE